jgi:hypothetical protein
MSAKVLAGTKIVDEQPHVAELKTFDPPVFGLWLGDRDSEAVHSWAMDHQGVIVHGPFRNAIAAMALERGGEVAEIGPDGKPIFDKPVITKIGPSTFPAAVITPNTLPLGTVGKPYSQVIVAAGHTLMLSGTSDLPAGLMLKTPAIETDLTGQSGVEILGTPTQSGRFDFTIIAKDSVGRFSASQAYTLTIAAK